MEDQYLFEGSDQKQADIKTAKKESVDQTTLNSPTNDKTLRGFVNGCRDNCLIQNDLKQPGRVYDSSNAGMS